MSTTTTTHSLRLHSGSDHNRSGWSFAEGGQGHNSLAEQSSTLNGGDGDDENEDDDAYDDQHLSFMMNIRLKDGSNEQLIIRARDDPYQIAINFVEKHKLPESLKVKCDFVPYRLVVLLPNHNIM